MDLEPVHDKRAMVLESKLRVPRTLGRVVCRTRLLNALVAHEQRGSVITVVNAPAGSGKTTLLAQRSQQLRSAGTPVGWLSLDADDNDPSALWSGILAASERAVHGVHSPTETALRGLGPPSKASAGGFLGEFYDAIGALPHGLWLAIDDVHELNSAAVLDGLGRLLKGCPPGLRLMLGCRRAPSIALPRMLLDGTAVEIGAGDLAFSRAECRELLSHHEIRLADNDLDLLFNRTEGWAAGLTLIARSLTRQDNPSAYIAAVAGDQQPLAEYLVSEVLSHLPDDVVDFLLTTSVPERLTAELAHELTTRADAGLVLDQLARDNVLVYRHDSAPRFYHYHSLLRSYLAAELQRRDADAERAAQRTAAHWFADHDSPRVALEHASKAHDWPLVVDLTVRYGLRLLLSGNGAGLIKTLDSAPAEVLAEPVVSLVAAVAALQDGQLATAQQHLDRAGPDPAVHSDHRIRSLHVATIVYAARLRGVRGQSAAELLGDATDQSTTDPILGLFSTANNGMLAALMGDFPTAEADLTKAVLLARETGCEFLTVDCLSHLAAIAATRGDYGAMATKANEAIALATDRGWARSSRLSLTYLIAGWAAWQAMDTAGAERYLSLSAELNAGVEPEAAFGMQVLSTFVAFNRTRNRRACLLALRSAWSRAQPAHLPPAIICGFSLPEVRMALVVGEPGWAAETAERATNLVGLCGDLHVMRALIHVDEGRNQLARETLRPALNRDIPCHVASSEIAAWLLEAHAAAASNEPARAHEACVRAIELAAPCNALRDVADASGRVRQLLIHAAGRFGAHDQFVQEVLAATRNSRTVQTASGEAAETITVRERELLRDLPSLLSIDEIAEAHVISVNTVKTHLKALYRKLAVSSRRDAVQRAREIGLL